MSALIHWLEALSKPHRLQVEWEPLDLWFSAQLSEIQIQADAWAPEDWGHSYLETPEGSSADAEQCFRLEPSETTPLLWLSRIAPPRSAESPIALRLANLYDRSLGSPDTPHPLALDYIRARHALTLKPHVTFDERALRFSLLQRYLLHRPARLELEILGVTLAYLHRSPARWESETHRRLKFKLLAECRQLYSEARDQGADPKRIERGFRLYQNEFRALIQHDSETVTAEMALIHLMQDKRRFAKGYHANLQVGDRTLDQWFSAEPFEGTPLLAHLRASRWIVAGDPEASPLLKLLSFGGPMFGVFSADEQETLKAWIQDPRQSVKRHQPLKRASKDQSARPRSKPMTIRSKRTLFKTLVQLESTLEAPPSAIAHLERVFRKAAWVNRLGFSRQLPPRYSLEALERCLETAHRKSLERYRQKPTQLKRDLPFCRWLIRQWAPAILCDGAWLWSAHTPDRHTLDRRLLAKTHLEEIGEGALEQNHPHIYRALMHQLELKLPSIVDPQFADDPLFRESAFHLPCLLLAMGLCSEHYWPELIGLNLAIETSGLGEHYLRAIDVLRSLKLDPKIIELHLSIDNLSSGHSRWALQSVETLMLASQSLGGDSLSNEIWARVRRGYAALTLETLPILIDTVRYKIIGTPQNKDTPLHPA